MRSLRRPAPARAAARPPAPASAAGSGPAIAGQSRAPRRPQAPAPSSGPQAPSGAARPPGPTGAAPGRPAGPRTPRQRAGDAAERAALDHLRRAGLEPLARNVRYRDGELDLVLRDRDTIVFAEVRLRRDPRFGGAAASVDRFKQNRILRCAQRWLVAHYGDRWPACRFDVVGLDARGGVDWVRDAFGA